MEQFQQIRDELKKYISDIDVKRVHENIRKALGSSVDIEQSSENPFVFIITLPNTGFVNKNGDFFPAENLESIQNIEPAQKIQRKPLGLIRDKDYLLDSEMELE